jgi:N-acetylglucosamine kinase-like BadF-type ATPase
VRCVLGIDAGGTKTVGLLADEAGSIIGQARAGGANLQTHGELGVEKAFDSIMESLGSRGRTGAICVGIAGVDRPHDEQVIRDVLRRLGYRERVRVVNDAVIALLAGAPERNGIVVLSGTGSIAYGIDPSGNTARAGGYGYLLADEGSGYWLGHQALRATMRAADGRGPETKITGLVLQALGVTSAADVVGPVYERALPTYEIAALARVVQQAREMGDVVAIEILTEAAHELSVGARAVAKRLSFGRRQYAVVLAGGVFKACPSLAGLVIDGLDLPLARPTRLEVEPALGAVSLALDLLRA